MGLENVDKMLRTGIGAFTLDKSSHKRDKLSYKGSVTLSSIMAADVGDGGR